MNRNIEQVYRELQELDNRAVFIKDVFKSIIERVYEIHPNLLDQSNQRKKLSNVLKNIHNKAIPYCERLQKDYDYFCKITREIDSEPIINTDEIELFEENYYPISKLNEITEETYEPFDHILKDTIIEETESKTSFDKLEKQDELINSNILDIYPSPSTLNNERLCSSSSSNWFFTSTQAKTQVDMDKVEENLIDFSCQINLENKLIQKIKKNHSVTNLSMSNSNGKSSKLSKSSALSKKIRYHLIDSNKSYECFVTHVVSPLLFFIQDKSIIQKVDDFQKKLNIYYDNKFNNNSTKCEFFDESLLYVGKYSYDNKWYRVKILSINEKENTAYVFYIDYGNCENLNFERIRTLDEYFYKELVYAIPVSLALACPTNGTNKWSEKSCNEFSNFALFRWAIIETIEVKNWPIYFCYLKTKIDNEYVDALEYLISQNHAKEIKNFNLIKLFQDQMREFNISFNFKDFFPQLDFKNRASSKSSQSSPHVNVKKQKISEPEKNQSSGEPKTKQEFVLKPTDKYTFKIEDLPQKTVSLDIDGSFKFEICEAFYPNDFYINLTNDRLDDYDLLEAEMFDFYEKNKAILKAFSVKKNYDFVFLNSICIAQDPKDGRWYRTQIKQLDLKNSDDYLIKVIYIDYGMFDNLSYENIYPLLTQFVNLPPYTTPCELDVTKTEPWSEKENEHFLNLIRSYPIFKARVSMTQSKLNVKFDFNKKLKLRFISAFDNNDIETSFELNDLMISYGTALQDDCESDFDLLESASCVKSQIIKPTNNSFGSLKLNLPKDDVNFKNQCLQRYLNDCQTFCEDKSSSYEDSNDFVKFESSSQKLKNEIIQKEIKENILVEEEGKKSKTIAQESKKNEKQIEIDACQDDSFENWNPIASEYYSVKNFYGFNEQNGEAHLFGFETQYEKDICDYYNRYGFCNKKNCHLYHKKRTETLVPSSTKVFKCFTNCNVSQQMLKNQVICLTNIRCISQDCFQAIITGGIEENIDQFTNLPKLIQSMTEYYGKKKFLPEKSTIFSKGQIVAARSNLHSAWLRAKVIEKNTIDQLKEVTYIIEYLDVWGCEELALTDLYLINERFLNTIPCRCTFSFSQIKITASIRILHNKFEKEAIKFKNYWAKVKNIEDSGKLKVDWFIFDDSQTICLKKLLIDQKHAIPIRIKSSMLS